MEKNAAHGSSKVLQALASTLDLPVATKKALAESPHRLSLARGQTMLPAYLIAYLQRRVTSTSLDDQGWGRFLTGDWLPSDTNVPRQAPPQRSVRTESGPKDDTEDTADGHADEERDEGMLRGTAILNVLESLAVSGSTLTVQDAVTALQGLPTSNWWPIELTLRDWARHHLTHPPQKRWAPSTLLSYFRALRSPLCATVEDFDIQNADDLSLLELFDGALGCVDSEGARHYLTHRLKEFYRYCRDRYPSMARDIDFRELDNAVFSHQAAVRTAFPLERDFRNTVDRLVRKSKFEDMPTRIQCSLLAGALGFRCGLRKTELAHIRVMDFQDGNLPELIVRPSQWGRLKSGQSERRIPLRAFLDESELAVLRTFHSLRTETALPSEALLTDHPVGRPLDGDTLLRPFLDSLRDVSGSRDFCTHSLRHGFANSTLIRFHIADGLELPRTIYALSDARFDKDACLNMVSALIGREAAQPLGFQYLYALAKLLGHLSPQTTLKSYIHVLDLLAHLLRRRIQPAITVEQAAALMGVTYRRLHQVLGRDGVPTRNADVGVFLQIMRKRNGEFPSSIQQNVLQGSDKSAAVRPRKNSASRLRKDSN